MLKNKLTSLLLAASMAFSISLVGCGETVKEDVKNGAEDVKEGVKDLGDNVADTTENLVDRVKDTTMDYDLSTFKKDLESKGIAISNMDKNDSLFSVDNEDFTINGDRVSVYEYGSGDSEKLMNDLKTITNNGATINGKAITWTAAPHVYKKGRIIVIYDGSNETTLTDLKDILGDPILG
ncbi:hypothetical protein [uncultured Clostridium sp.]|uniref:hypothetical protein n=1 Tax=uncultured Clostridium sp. TaxID=59620 RepID=UPI0025CCE168|nr:hypothetical protein [uncultured Clostridium sp.]